MKQKRIAVIFLITLLITILIPKLASAQVVSGSWSTVIRLSDIRGIYIDSSNVMTSDPYGYLHIFWFESGSQDSRFSIQYTRFDGKTWTAPLDIFVGRPNTPLSEISPFVDKNGTLHLFWTTSFSGETFYAYVPALDALSLRRWSKPVPIDIRADEIKLLVDSKGTLHLLYSVTLLGQQTGIYYIRSEDQGETWSQEVWLDPDGPSNYIPGTIQFRLDEFDGLHALWFYRSNLDNSGNWIRYSNSSDGGHTWSAPFTIDEADESEDELRMPYPELAVSGRSVHVIWAGNSFTNREHRFSNDLGKTWSETKRVFGDLSGQAIGDGVATDAVGRIHFIGQLRYPHGLHHAYWDQDHWVGPSLFYLIRQGGDDEIGNRIHAHAVRAAIRGGNQLVVTFYDRSEERPPVLYAMYRSLDDIKPLPLQPTPTLTPAPSPTLPPISSINTSLNITPTPIFFQSDPEISSLQAGSSIGATVSLALVPGLLFIISIFLLILHRKRLMLFDFRSIYRRRES